MNEEKFVKEMPLLPLRGLSIFPHMLIHLDVGRKKSIKAIEKAMVLNKKVFLISQKNAITDSPNERDLYKIGTIAEIKQVMKMPAGTLRILIEGLERAELAEYNDGLEYVNAKCIPLISSPYRTEAVEAEVRLLFKYYEEHVKLNKKIPNEAVKNIVDLKDPERVADGIVSSLVLSVARKQQFLEIYDLKDRVNSLIQLLANENEILKAEKKIDMMVKKQIDKNQREYFLREQVKAINEELGESDGRLSETKEYKEKIEKNKLPKDAREKALKEISRLEKMSPNFGEAANIRNYLDWITELPWNKSNKVGIDIKRATEILDEDHYGLKNIKERILEYLAVAKLTKSHKNPIICFVGPPGVGKTSLAKSISKALNRKFVRISLGGVRDEAEIRGHRRTYVGAMPGRIIKAYKTTDSNNPLVLLDEIDKMSSDFKGDPSSALLEVLDPEQNKTFSDHFIEVPFDLSKTFFITTANSLYNIPRPLLDRMEIIQLSGYIEDEKLEIAKKYLLPRQKENHGIKEEKLKVSDNAILKVIRNHTREAGVRNLERELATICRKTAKIIAENKEKNIVINEKGVFKYLGRDRFTFGMKEEKGAVGISSGLAWTAVGGDILQIEVLKLEGKNKLILTGKLGDVMKESAQIAYSYVKSLEKELELTQEDFDKKDLHIHVPEGAIPKDGPSAGVTMCTAIVSALTNKPVKAEVAMTGELTLRGRVLPVGGIKEKVLAAHRAGYTRIILPYENKKNLEEIPKNIQQKLDFIFVKEMKEVLENALMEEKLEDK